MKIVKPLLNSFKPQTTILLVFRFSFRFKVSFFGYWLLVFVSVPLLASSDRITGTLSTRAPNKHTYTHTYIQSEMITTKEGRKEGRQREREINCGENGEQRKAKQKAERLCSWT